MLAAEHPYHLAQHQHNHSQKSPSPSSASSITSVNSAVSSNISSTSVSSASSTSLVGVTTAAKAAAAAAAANQPNPSLDAASAAAAVAAASVSAMESSSSPTATSHAQQPQSSSASSSSHAKATNLKSGRDTVREYRHALTMSNTMRLAKQRKTLTTDAVADLKRRVAQYNSMREDPSFHIQLEETQSTVLFFGVVKITSFFQGNDCRSTLMRINNRVMTADVISALLTKYHLTDSRPYELFVHSRGHECSLMDSEFPLEIKLLLDTDPSFPDNNVEFFLRSSQASNSDNILGQTIDNPLFDRQISSSSAPSVEAGIRLKTGYLNKRSMAPGTTRNWKVCYFVLTNESLAYYKSSNDSKPTAVFHISQISDIEYVDESLIRRKNCFRMACPSYVFCCAVDEKACKDWVERLRQVRQMWDLHPSQQKQLLSQRRHWRYVGHIGQSPSTAGSGPVAASSAVAAISSSNSRSRSGSHKARDGNASPANNASANGSTSGYSMGTLSIKDLKRDMITGFDASYIFGSSSNSNSSESGQKPGEYNSKTFGAGFPAIGFLSPAVSRANSMIRVEPGAGDQSAENSPGQGDKAGSSDNSLVKLGKSLVRRASARFSRRKARDSLDGSAASSASNSPRSSIVLPSPPSSPSQQLQAAAPSKTASPNKSPKSPVRSRLGGLSGRIRKDTLPTPSSPSSSSSSSSNAAASTTTNAATTTTTTSSAASTPTAAASSPIINNNFQSIAPGMYGSLMIHDVEQKDLDVSGIEFDDDDYYGRYIATQGDSFNPWEGISTFELECFVESLNESEISAVNAVRARYNAHKLLLLQAIESLTEDKDELDSIRAQIAALQEADQSLLLPRSPSSKLLSSKSSSTSSVAGIGSVSSSSSSQANHHNGSGNGNGNGYGRGSNAGMNLNQPAVGSMSSINSISSSASAASSGVQSNISSDSRSTETRTVAPSAQKAANRLSWSGMVSDASLSLSTNGLLPSMNGHGTGTSGNASSASNSSNLNSSSNGNTSSPEKSPKLRRSKSLTRSELRKSKREIQRAQKDFEKRQKEIEKEKRELEKRQKDLEKKERDLLMEQERERDRQLKKRIKAGMEKENSVATPSSNDDSQADEEGGGLFARLVRRRSTIRKKHTIESPEGAS